MAKTNLNQLLKDLKERIIEIDEKIDHIIDRLSDIFYRY